MLTSLGRAPGGESLVESLAACHQRIRRFVELAAVIASPDAARRPARELGEAAAAVHRYFAIALPLHVADEDLSLTPRLVGRDPVVDAALARLAVEHADHEPALARLCELTSALAADPARHAALGPVLAPLAAELRAGFEAHLALEEAVVFPAVAGLPAADQAAIVRELRDRRG